MITLKLKYRLKDEQDMSLILGYQRQYSSCLHFLYNRISDNISISEKELRLLYDNINNCSLINKWLFQCAIKEARQIYNSHGAKVIFGGKANYFKRNKLAISKEEYKAKRISPIYSIGEADKSGNRMFRLKQDNILTFQPNRLCHIDLELVGLGRYRDKILRKLTELAKQKKTTITYKLSSEYVWISYDEKLVTNIETSKIKNHKVSRKIVEYMEANSLNTLFVGKNVGWKDSINLGRTNNQNFVSIPYNMLIHMLEYKCKLAGINAIIVNEAYTSKCSFLDREKISKHNSYAGRRVKRGLFISNIGILINADVNGSLNIMRLGLERQNVKLDVIEEILRPENKRFVFNPVRICA